jgi:hypothetical protein
MISVGTIGHPLEFIRENEVKNATLDIETMDSKMVGLWNEPIVSYAISFPSGSIASLHCPTYGSVIHNLREEPKLLEQLITILGVCKNHRIIICGHNVICSYKHVQKVASWKSGYDLPKIMKRASRHGMNSGFLPDLKVFDTMDVVVVSYDHHQHDRTLYTGAKQMILGLQAIENDFDIIRPEGQEKLGPVVREIYMEYLKTTDLAKLKQILLYNCVDSLVESIVTSVFCHCINECKQTHKLVSPRSRCSHIPNEFPLERMPEWEILSSSNFSKRTVLSSV